jgi:hypothetical protein
MEGVEENRKLTRAVLDKLALHSLKCRPSKCLFEQEEVEFLGVDIGRGSMKVTTAKTQAIQAEQPPKMKKQLRCFLGITGYHRKFIKGYTDIAKPLHTLTREVPFVWTNDQQKAFEELKRRLISAPVLSFSKNEGKFHLEVDASDQAIGVVLSQLQDHEW